MLTKLYTFAIFSLDPTNFFAYQVDANNHVCKNNSNLILFYYIPLGKIRPGLKKRSNADEVVHFCNLQLVETVPDVLVEKRISPQLTKQSIFHVID